MRNWNDFPFSHPTFPYPQDIPVQTLLTSTDWGMRARDMTLDPSLNGNSVAWVLTLSKLFNPSESKFLKENSMKFINQ